MSFFECPMIELYSSVKMDTRLAEKGCKLPGVFFRDLSPVPWLPSLDLALPNSWPQCQARCFVIDQCTIG